MDASKITFKADLTGYEILLLRNLVDKRIQELKKRVEISPSELCKKYDEEEIAKLTPLLLKLDKIF